jgi:hypothetical protein
MFTIQNPSKRFKKSPPSLACLPLAAFDSGDLDCVRKMFQTIVRHPLKQAWLEKEEADFAPGFVRIGWRENSLLVFAELIDVDIFNAATSLNQRAWEMGDTFEIFLQPVDYPMYFEFQVTPNNHRVQLQFANIGDVENIRKSGSVEPALMYNEAFRSRTWINHNVKCWYVYAEIEAEKLGDQAGPLQGRQWRFSFGRYDYTRNRSEPIISSTSLHAEPDFHRQQEWGVIDFES